MYRYDMHKLLKLANENGWSLNFVCKKTGISVNTLQANMHHKCEPSTDTLCRLALWFKVPISAIIDLNDIEYKDTLKDKWDREDFVVPDNCRGEVTYQPLRDLVESFYIGREDKKTINDLYDMIPCNESYATPYRMNGTKKALAKRGIEFDPENTQVTGMSAHLRACINNDRPVRFYTIWAICKLLGCNIDFVMGYK